MSDMYIEKRLPSLNLPANFEISTGSKIMASIPVIGLVSNLIENSLQQKIDSESLGKKKVELINLKGTYNTLGIIREVIMIAIIVALFAASIIGFVPFIILTLVAAAKSILEAISLSKNKEETKHLAHLLLQQQKVLEKTQTESLPSTSQKKVHVENLTKNSPSKAQTPRKPSFSEPLPPKPSPKLTINIPQSPGAPVTFVPFSRLCLSKDFYGKLALSLEGHDPITKEKFTNLAAKNFNFKLKNKECCPLPYYFAICLDESNNTAVLDAASFLRNNFEFENINNPCTNKKIVDISFYFVNSLNDKTATFFASLSDFKESSKGNIKKKFISATDLSLPDDHVNVDQVGLATAYESGYGGTKVNTQLAIKWYKIAADNGNYFAHYRLSDPKLNKDITEDESLDLLQQSLVLAAKFNSNLRRTFREFKESITNNSNLTEAEKKDMHGHLDSLKMNIDDVKVHIGFILIEMAKIVSKKDPGTGNQLLKNARKFLSVNQFKEIFGTFDNKIKANLEDQ